MSWFDDLEKLFEREVDSTEFEAIFQRMDVTRFFGTLNNLWSPRELISKVGGPSGLDILYKDPDIYAAIDKRLSALNTSKITLEGQNSAIVSFFEEQLIPHERQLKQDFWWTIFNGYGVEQIIYDEDMSGRVAGFQKEEFWRFEPQRDIIHVKCIHTDNSELRNKILPYGKWVLTTNNGTSYRPTGDMMAERLITPWIVKCTGWDLWIDFARRFANGFMHASIEDMEKKDEVRDALAQSGKSSILVTDKNSTLQLIQASRDSSLYQSLDEKTVGAINRVILGETLTSDVNGGGSFAAAKVHNGVREEKTWADIDMVEKALNEVIRQIGDVNGLDPADLPKATLSWDPDFSIEQVTRDQGLHGMGVRFSKSYIAKTYGIEEEEFEIKEETQAPSWGFSQKKKSTFLSAKDMKDFIGIQPACGHKLDANTARKSRRHEDEKEEIVDFLNKNASPPLDPDDLISAIMTSKNEKELDEKLEALFSSRNNAFADDMTEALYYAAARGAMLGNPEVLKNEED